MERVVFSPKYKPLFRPRERDDPRYTVITGGRGSGKTFASATANMCSTYDDPYNILYTRYSLVSAELSIIPEYLDKVDLLGRDEDFYVTKNTIRNLSTGALIYFRGLIQSSKNQTGRLKSISKMKRWVLDEAQELVNRSTFETIDLSIREKEVTNEVQLSLNPTDIHHWIYDRFFRKPGGVPYDFNGRIDNVRYIHTDWRDNRANLSKSFIDLALQCEREDPDRYANIYLGDWSIRRSGLIYPRWKAVTLADIPLGLEWWYCNDWGYSGDPDALCRMAFDPLTRSLYVVEVMYSTGKLPKHVAAAIRQDCEARGADAEEALVYCDPARPDSIEELRVQYGINAMKGINRDKVGRIGYLQGFRVYYVGEHIGAEANTYSWKPSEQDSEVFTDTPQDGNDHCFVGSTMIMTKQGEKRIDTIAPGDYVLTSNGYRRVLNVFDNGCKKIREYSIKFCNFGIDIQATPDHKFKTEKGWKQLQDLSETDSLFLCKSSRGRNIDSTQGKDILAGTTNDYTELFGNTLTDQFQKDSKSTTVTETHGTTTLKTLNLSRSGGIKANTTRKMSKPIPNHIGEEWSTRRGSPRSGIVQRKGENGIKSMPAHKHLLKGLNTPATTVANPLCRQSATPSTTSAHENVRLRSAVVPGRTILSNIASGAEKSSNLTNTTSRDSVVQLALAPIVEVRVISEKTERVYDLMVEDMHEYFANGILVHNCMDAISYGTTHLRRMGIPNDYDALPK